MAEPLTTDDINVRVTARLSASIVVGLYDGPITHRVIDAIETDGGMTLVAS